MNYAFESDLRYGKEEARQQSIALGMSLRLDGLFHSGDIEQELATNEAGVRREIFTMVTGQILPKITANTDINHGLPEGETSTRSQTKISNSYAVERETGAIDNNMRITMNVSADRSLNGIQALYAERGGLASAITNNVTHSLKATFFGVTHSTSNDEWKLEGNQVQEYKGMPMAA